MCMIQKSSKSWRHWWTKKTTKNQMFHKKSARVEWAINLNIIVDYASSLRMGIASGSQVGSSRIASSCSRADETWCLPRCPDKQKVNSLKLHIHFICVQTDVADVLRGRMMRLISIKYLFMIMNAWSLSSVTLLVSRRHRTIYIHKHKTYVFCLFYG